jgi:hypothetical protein
MNIRFLLIVLVLSFIFNSSDANMVDTNSVDKKKVILVSSSLALYFGGSFYYVQNAWWDDISNDFHFDSGNDLVYALNVDKAGHFFGGVYASDLFSSSFRWAGMKKSKSVLYGAVFGTGVQLAIELKDAYAPYWGFSKWDLGLGSAGAIWPMIQHHIRSARAIDFKFSYFKRSNIYWDLESQRGRDPNRFSWYDDYPNQTYWMSVDLDYFMDSKVIPKWLDVAFGFGLDDTQYLDEGLTKMGGNQEYYLALDYDIEEILKKWDSPLAKKVKFFLKYVKLPAPTIRFTPELKFYPFFI